MEREWAFVRVKCTGPAPKKTNAQQGESTHSNIEEGKYPCLHISPQKSSEPGRLPKNLMKTWHKLTLHTGWAPTWPSVHHRGLNLLLNTTIQSYCVVILDQILNMKTNINLKNGFPEYCNWALICKYDITQWSPMAWIWSGLSKGNPLMKFWGKLYCTTSYCQLHNLTTETTTNIVFASSTSRLTNTVFFKKATRRSEVRHKNKWCGHM